ncbi:hypothetical protein CMT37_18470 [Elizabethkingia anophelis]|nr:hypothetical protein [Elizabethkingia anophelis]
MKRIIKVVQEKVPGYFDVSGINHFYVLDGSDYSFNIKTNSDWTAEIISDPDNIINTYKLSGTGNESSTAFIFSLRDRLQLAITPWTTAQIRFHSIKGEFPDRTVSLTAGSGRLKNPSTSYMVMPLSEGIQIPIVRANGDGTTRISNGQSFTAELLWTDSPNGMGVNGVVSSIHTIGTGPNGRILVVPGGAMGNAVVVAKVNGTIVWSWHIWSSSYQPGLPASGTFMDRNLGATSNSPNNVNTFGLFYQWGRKDPFPGAGATTQNVPRKIYNGVGMEISSPYINGTTTINGAVQNPLTFYGKYDGSVSYDWLSPQNNNLWGGANLTTPFVKDAYDPCPEGWRVPAFKNDISPWEGLTHTNGGVWNNGYTWPSHGGYYPAAGFRDPAGGGLSHAGTSGYSWSASSYSTHSISIDIYRDIINPGILNHRGSGFPVRCVRE